MKREAKVKKKIDLEEKRWFNEQEAADYTGIPRDTLRKIRYARQIAYGVRKGGRSIVYDKKGLDEYMEKQNSFYKAAPVDDFKF